MVVFTLADLDNVPPARGMGGRTACRWQQSLRKQCIASNMFRTDLTFDAVYNWKQLLRSVEQDFAADIIGQGIVRVVFRVLEPERDRKNNENDGYGRHFFEFIRPDGSVHRLRYRKFRSPAGPTYVDPPRNAAHPAVPGGDAATQTDVPGGGADQAEVPGGGAAQPAESGGDAPLLFTLDDLLAAARLRQTVGPDEASLALHLLLRHHHGVKTPGAVDITDGSAFDWLHWLRHIQCAPDIFRDVVHRVCAVRWKPRRAPQVVFCYRDNTYSTLVPFSPRSTGSRKETRFVFYKRANWLTEPLLSAAPAASESWLLLQGKTIVIIIVIAIIIIVIVIVIISIVISIIIAILVTIMMMTGFLSAPMLLLLLPLLLQPRNLLQAH